MVIRTYIDNNTLLAVATDEKPFRAAVSQSDELIYF